MFTSNLQRKVLLFYAPKIIKIGGRITALQSVKQWRVFLARSVFILTYRHDQNYIPRHFAAKTSPIASKQQNSVAQLCASVVNLYFLVFVTSFCYYLVLPVSVSFTLVSVSRTIIFQFVIVSTDRPYIIFIAHLTMLERAIAVDVCLSVRPSVSPSVRQTRAP